MENNITLSPEAVKAIEALQHGCGTYQFYRTHIDRLFNYILDSSDEIGMSDTEAMATLRALNSLRADLAAIAGAPAPALTDEEILLAKIMDHNTEDCAE